MASLYYLGVDGGGSKTLAVIVDEQGRECGRGLAGSANYVAVGLELAIQNIYSAVMRATHEVADALPLCKAWLGLAGVDRPSDSALLVSHLHTLASSVQITNDADLALSALPGVAGIVLIVGTGSIALGRNEEGSVTRVGGWGHILGDEGSGYDIGRQGLQVAVRTADGRGKSTILLELILRHWQLSNAEDIIGAVYTLDKAKIAQTAACVMEAAQQGDQGALIIVERAADELALLVQTVRPNVSQRSSIPLAIGGGLLLHDDFFREYVIHHIQRQQAIKPIVRVEQPALSAARAAIML